MHTIVVIDCFRPIAAIGSGGVEQESGLKAGIRW